MLARFLSSVFLALLFASAPLSAQGPQDAARELRHLQAEYGKQQADALRPVTLEYQRKLEALRKSFDERNDIAALAVVDVAIAGQKQAFWEQDQPELAAAITHGRWRWCSEVDADGVDVIFRESGAVEHLGLRGSWKITGPSEVTVKSEDGGDYLLRFNASQTAYTGDRQQVHGNRVAQATAPTDFAGIRWGAPPDAVRAVMTAREGVKSEKNEGNYSEHLAFSGGKYVDEPVLSWRFDFDGDRLREGTIDFVVREGVNALGFPSDQTEWRLVRAYEAIYGRPEQIIDEGRREYDWRFPSTSADGKAMTLRLVHGWSNGFRLELSYGETPPSVPIPRTTTDATTP